jgi:phospholipase C
MLLPLEIEGTDSVKVGGNAVAERDAIEHVIVLILENRSYDHMLGYLQHPDPSVGTLAQAPMTCPLDPQDPGSERFSTEPSAEPRLGGDPAHSNEEVRHQVFGTSKGWSSTPTMDGFIASYARRIEDGADALPQDIMRCFAEEHIPVLAALAKRYAVFTRWFSSVPGETWPNRNFAHAGTSGGEVDIVKRFYLDDTVFERLEDAGLDRPWTVYHDEIPQVWVFPKLWMRRRRNFKPMSTLFSDIEQDRLPKYSFIEPNHGFGKGNGNSQHPSNNLTTGESFVSGERLMATIHNALVASPEVFNKTLLFITYDEHGGFVDHVEPERVLPPKADMKCGDFQFDLTGVRVPAVAVSPRITPGTVVGETFEHSSIPRTLRSQFAPDSRALSSREAAAADILDHLDLGDVVPREPIPLPPLLDQLEAPTTVHEVNEFEASLLELASAVGNLLHMRFALPAEGEPPFITLGPMHEAAETGVLVAGSQAELDARALVAEFHADNAD